MKEWCFLCKMAETKMVEFMMAAIIKLSQNEWVKFSCANVGKGSVSEVFFVQMVGTNLGMYECVWEEKLRWLNPRWWNSWWLSSSSSVRMNEFESEWISLSSESEWMESVFECVWEKLTRCLNLTWQCLNPIWQNSSWLPSFKLSENEWVWVRLN